MNLRFVVVHPSFQATTLHQSDRSSVERAPFNPLYPRLRESDLEAAPTSAALAVFRVTGG